MARLRIALCQLNTVVGDLEGNAAQILAALDAAEQDGADLAVFPELAVTGYPPEDLVLRPGFVADNEEVLAKIAARTGRCAAVVGFVDAARDLHNAAAVCADGEIKGVYRKRLLPNSGVFDEQRTFTPGTEPMQLFVIGGVRVGVSICEDAWSPTGPIAQLAAGGAELVVNINASPYYRGRRAERERMLATRAADASCAIVYVNLVGGQDELVFDGGSMVFDHTGALVASMPLFTAEQAIVDVDVEPVFRKRLLDPRGRVSAPALPEVVLSAEQRPSLGEPTTACAAWPEAIAEVHQALVLGIRDYVRKNGFSDVVLGLSGGIDSSLVAALAVDALGAEHVHGVLMPSRYSSDGSVTDALALCEQLGIEHRTIAIEPAHATLLEMLAPSFGDRRRTSPRRTCRAASAACCSWRCRTSTAGWCSPPATRARWPWATPPSTATPPAATHPSRTSSRPTCTTLCRHINARAGREIVPEAVLTKPPSAELRPDQRDDQSLPPYELLDPMLRSYVEDDRTVGRAHRPRLRAGARAAHRPARRPRRVQAAPEPARHPRHPEGVRQGPPRADREPLPRLTPLQRSTIGCVCLASSAGASSGWRFLGSIGVCLASSAGASGGAARLEQVACFTSLRHGDLQVGASCGEAGVGA
jgi:NAD+ synthase (glutamine-hydrolysing)